MNQKPSRITLDQVSVTLNEGQLPQGALSRITITDDGLGSVGLAPLPASSIFEYRAVPGERGVYDLHLKAGVVLDQALVGNHPLRVVVTGDGAGNNLLPHADFTLRASDIEHDPVLIVTPPANQPVINETIGNAVTLARIDTGITVRASDRDGNLRGMVIEIWRDDSWQADNRFEVTSNSLFIRAGQQLDYEDADNPGGVIWLRITASDAAGNSVRQETELFLTNVNEPTTGSVRIDELTNGAFVMGTGSLTAGPDFTDPDDPNLEITTKWVRVDGGMDPVDDRSFTPTVPGQYMLMTLVIDRVTNTPHDVLPLAFTVKAPPPPPDMVPGIELAHTIYENHPLTKPIIDLPGDGQFRMADIKNAPDNAFFRVDGAGKIWFVPTRSYALLDAENHRASQLHPHWHLKEVLRFRFPQVEDAIESWVDTHRSELPDADRQAEAEFMKTLLYGRVWAMPQEGPLIIAWSFATPQSPLGSRNRHRDPYDPNNPEGGQRYLVSQDKIETYREVFERAMAEYEAIANLKFVEVGEVQDTHAMMRVNITWSKGKSGAASLDVHKGGYIRIDHPHHYSTVLHEIIHALVV